MLQASSVPWHSAADGVFRAPPTAVGLSAAWARPSRHGPAAHAAAGVAAASIRSTTECVPCTGRADVCHRELSTKLDHGMVRQVRKRTVALRSCFPSPSQLQARAQSSKVNIANVPA